MMAIPHIDHIQGFTSMSQLAGRGVIVCLKDQVKQVNGKWVCMTTDDDTPDTEVPAKAGVACCNLHYSAEGDSLSADGSRQT